MAKNTISKYASRAVLYFVLLSSVACQKSNTVENANSFAPGAPGDAPTWAFSGKRGIGTSYEAYMDGSHGDAAATGEVSTLWFSIANGVLTETMVGLIHEAQLKDQQFIIVGKDFVDLESVATDSKIDYLHKDEAGRPLSLAYKITNADKENLYTIEKHIFSDSSSNVLFQRVIFKPLVEGLKLFAIANPHINNTGINDRAWVDASVLYAQEGSSVMAMLSSNPWQNASVGFKGVSDLETDLNDGAQNWFYSNTGETTGNVILSAEVPLNKSGETQFDMTIAFASDQKSSLALASKTLAKGYEQVLAKYNGEGDFVGWQDYLQSLTELNSLYVSSADGGKLANASALVLKAQEDKTHSGALIASLSNPWGDSVSAEIASTGYKAVWPRDFYQCAMAFLALGDSETALTAFKYLEKVQVSDKTPGNTGVGGWFLQKTHVDGELEWIAVQLDQTAMPIMLGWKLWQLKVLSDQEIQHWYKTMLAPAAHFLVDGGKVALDWNDAEIKPPFTQQERWEEQEGYSPSTTAAVIAGLVAAAELAELSGDADAKKKFLSAADNYSAQLERRMVTDSGVYLDAQNEKRYFLRITRDEDPNNNGLLLDRNGRGEVAEKEILDGGFLELVRYGVRAPNNADIRATLWHLDNTELDDRVRIKYEFNNNGMTIPGWRRYGEDGYGEDTATGGAYAEGGNHSPTQRGRVWPFFTGERGHYEIANIGNADALNAEEIKKRYIAGMEFFANEGLMLPEQVWDGVGKASAYNYALGEGTNSATPLAWTHAEYLKLLRSFRDKQVWDSYSIVSERYRKQ